MIGLLRDLQPLHQWRLHLWHGDHGWHEGSADRASDLQLWARRQGLPIQIERQDPSHRRDNREAFSRHWRYTCLRRQALQLCCSHVLTAHTASDRAETVLLHLARGSHSRGLAALRRRLPLDALLSGSGTDSQPQHPGPPDPVQPSRPDAPWLVRPLQLFSRQDTLRICREQGWPIWHDPSNAELALSRNRIRARVLPVLEELHPGACRRICAQAERLAAEQEQQQELLDLALMPLLRGPLQLDRRLLTGLSGASQGVLLQHWLRRSRSREIDSRSLAELLPRLPLERGSGTMDLAGGWQLSWRGTTLALRLTQPSTPCGHG